MAKPYSFEPRREDAANYNMYSNTTNNQHVMWCWQ